MKKISIEPKFSSGCQPDGSVIVRLKKALYGLKESAKEWYEYLKAVLITLD